MIGVSKKLNPITCTLSKLSALCGLVAFSTSALAQAGQLLDRRPVSWDSMGMLPLDSFRPVSDVGRACMKHAAKYDYGTVQLLAEETLQTKDDFFAAWYLTQSSRIRHTEKETLRKVQSWLGKRPKSQPLYYVQLVTAYNRAFNHPETRSYYDDYLRIACRSGEFLTNGEPELAFTLVNYNIVQLDNCREICDRLARKFPNVNGILMAQAFMAMSQVVTMPASRVDPIQGPDVAIEAHFDIAETIINKVLSKQPDYAPAVYYLGRCKLLSHKKPEGEALLLRFTRMPNALPRMIERARFVLTQDRRFYHNYYD